MDTKAAVLSIFDLLGVSLQSSEATLLAELAGELRSERPPKMEAKKRWAEFCLPIVGDRTVVDESFAKLILPETIVLSDGESVDEEEEDEEEEETEEKYIGLSTPRLARQRAATGQCDLCRRFFLNRKGEKIGLHHLIPKLQLKRNRQKHEKTPTALTAICGGCHSLLHKHFTHSELARRFPTVEALQADQQLKELLAIYLLEHNKF